MSFFEVMFHDTTPLFIFLSQTLHNFNKGGLWKWKFSDLLLLALNFTKFFMPFLEPTVNFSSNFVWLFSFTRHYSCVLVHLKLYMLSTKRAHQSTSYCSFECFNERSPNSWCFFETTRSAFIQILHHCSVSWKITSLYFLAQTLYNLDKKSSSKWNFQTWMVEWK